ncbi:MAG: OmpA family protein [Prevotellaceae bacterium]|jgi:outer membrane protein OmpA-like peptidoglycan-associated protein|nr:OmpA family protein [Prevotellaceae bacterium]
MKQIMFIVLMTISTVAFTQEEKYKMTRVSTQNGNVWGAIPTIDEGIIFVENTGSSTNAETYSSRLVIMDKNTQESTLSIFEQYQRIGSPYISGNGSEFYFVVSGIAHSSKSRNIFKSGTTYYPLQLMVTTSAGKEWSQPVAFQYNSNTYSTDDPCLSPDGTYLYFTSDKPGGYGGTDIYRSKRNSDGSWGEPENLGGHINSTGNERFPRIDTKGNFYFSSSSIDSNLDLFVCAPDGNNFQAPVKMDAPFNSESDDFAISFIDENSGYISSNRDGADNIYLFELTVQKKIEPVKAVEIIKDTIKVIETVKADTIKTQTPDAILLDYLKKEKLQYINFDFDKWQITDKHIPALKNLMDFMKQHPTVIMEVSGYTDCRGKSDYNLRLSHKRATAVRDYLVTNGIDSNHIVVKEFGATNPLIDCEKSTTEIAHETNRRVEYKVLKY